MDTNVRTRVDLALLNVFPVRVSQNETTDDFKAPI
jgi:hypothetical protein